MPLCSAIALTMKFGPLPIYVIAPKNTDPKAIALRMYSDTPATSGVFSAVGKPIATVWNATAVGELSKNAESPPDA